jgi:hypothetical protein
MTPTILAMQRVSSGDFVRSGGIAVARWGVPNGGRARASLSQASSCAKLREWTPTSTTREQVGAETELPSRPDRSGVTPEHSYGVWPVKRAGVIGPAVRGVSFGGGSASAVVDVCVATHMRGLVPLDRVCEVRGGAVVWRRAWPVGAARSVLSGRSSRRCAGALSSPSRWWWRLVHRRECPAVSGEFAGDGDDDDRAGLASSLERVPAFVESAGAAVGLGSHGE